MGAPKKYNFDIDKYVETYNCMPAHEQSQQAACKKLGYPYIAFRKFLERSQKKEEFILKVKASKISVFRKNKNG